MVECNNNNEYLKAILDMWCNIQLPALEEQRRSTTF